jgi:tripartite-type tricarboxylate transporter receptor subunit TctC
MANMNYRVFPLRSSASFAPLRLTDVSSFVAPILVVLSCTLTAGSVCAQPTTAGTAYPSKAIRIVTGGTGSNSDLISRLLAQGLTGIVGQPVIVDNRPSGVILGEIVARAAPDGYTLLVSGSSFWLAPYMQDKLPWDPVSDFLPVILATSTPNIIAVHPAVPVKSVKDLIGAAKARPGELNYASGSTGSTPHLAAELFKAMAGVNITRINYKGSGPALQDLIGGQVQVMFPTGPSAMPHVKAGRLRVLAVTSAQPSALVPGVPTVAATGVPGYEMVSFTGMFAPAKTPKSLITRLNQDAVRMLGVPESKERFLNAGAETVGGTPDQFGAAVKSEMARLGKLIRDAGIRAE